VAEATEPAEIAKRLVGTRAVDFVQSGMRLGIGTGSTVYWFIKALAERVHREGLSIQGIATSEGSAQLCRSLGLTMVSLNHAGHLDLAVDGADEVDPQGCLIKGGGGALVRERLVARAAERFLVIVDQSKVVDRLGRFPLPIEVVPFGWRTTADHIAALGAEPILRVHEKDPFVSDNGNYILDAKWEAISDPQGLYRSIKLIAGVVDAGIFSEFTPTVLVADDTQVDQRSPK